MWLNSIYNHIKFRHDCIKKTIEVRFKSIKINGDNKIKINKLARSECFQKTEKFRTRRIL